MSSSPHLFPAVRDALAKALYDRIFRWIVNRINQLLAPTAAQMVDEREIGILDIFGFEKFEENNFEQLCINMANEQLQFFFVEHVFLLEKEEYKKEGLTGLDINCSINKPLLVRATHNLLGHVNLCAKASLQCDSMSHPCFKYAMRLYLVWKRDINVCASITLAGYFLLQACWHSLSLGRAVQFSSSK